MNHGYAEEEKLVCSLRIWPCLVVTLWMFNPLFSLAQEPSVNSGVSYLSFAAPEAMGTYPMSVNNSMAVTGYYYASWTVARGFVREADGTFTTFDVMGSPWTEPESINDSGEITGYYLVDQGVPKGVIGITAWEPQGFLRYADGRIVTFSPPCVWIYQCNASQPVSINAFGDIAGSYPYTNGNVAGFTRWRDGTFTTYFGEVAGSDGSYGTAATAINGSGTVAGFFWSVYYSLFGMVGFQEDARGNVSSQIYIPQPDGYYPWDIIVEGINADGAIAGWYGGCAYPVPPGGLKYCNPPGVALGGFVLSSQGNYTPFVVPGILVTAPRPDFDGIGGEVDFYQDAKILSGPHRLSINQAGSITGSYLDTAGAQHGFVRNPYGTITPFDPPRGGLTTATSINDSGVIAGSYFYAWNSQTAQGFLRLPKP